tara:strand:+ start:272 stop:943 length:672 start_codon:yes stop_codon:yes gene_type:complete
LNFDTSRIVVIAPHPDDETLGLGGAISKFSRLGSKIFVLVVSGHLPPLYPKKSFESTKKEAIKAFNIMGVHDYEFAEIPATYVHQKPISEINGLINKFIKKHNPNIVFIPFPDRHIDHRTIFDSSVVASRPIGNSFPKAVLAYETLSETHWNVQGIEPSFLPDLYIDISNDIESKNKALGAYKSQISGNSSRSIDASIALAKFRGSQNGCEYAESFKVVRIIL